jgi:predicted CopG family antitoxin
MPPNGLWPIPRHHLYNGTPSRPTFNAKDFEKAETASEKGEMARTHGSESALAKFEAQLEDTNTTKKKKKDRKDKKNKKRRVSSTKNEEAGSNKTGATSSADVGAVTSEAISLGRTPASPNTKAKRTKEGHEVSSDVLLKLAKKRKRKSDSSMAAQFPSTKKTEDTKKGGFNIGADMVKNIENTMAAMGTHFGQVAKEPAEKKSKKTRKSDSKKAAAVSAMGVGLELQRSLSGQSSNQMKSGKGTQKEPRKKAKIGEHGSDEPALRRTPSPRKKTAVPLPAPSTPPTIMPLPQPTRNKSNVTAEQSEIIVPETPPSSAVQGNRTYIRTPIPLPSLAASKSHPFKALKSSESALKESALEDQQEESSLKLTQPLSDEPKPKPQPRQRASRASSVTSSVASSKSSSVSIIDLFNRVAKPYARSGAGVDPFATLDSKKPKSQESHEEAQLKEFNERFNAVLQSVNFTVEKEYLNQHLDWYLENGTEYPFPCLGKGSGCTPKKEDALRLSKEKKGGVSMKNAVAVSGGDASALHEVTERAEKAEQFLMLAIRARVPVPIGRLEGTWTLYCPEYSAHHYDRYGYGARTLTISSIAGFHDKNAYTARLSIPPRSVTYSILTFSVPPHASFRKTVIKTAQEGYTMDAIFLGNGFLQLRVDLNLLLTGKSTEMVGGRKVYMEFVGIHEKAVEWEERKDEVEEEGRKLFARYGGVDDD